MLHRFDIMPSVSMIGPAKDLLIVLNDLFDAYSYAEEYHEEYQQWEYAYLAKRMKDKIYKKITAIETSEILNSPEEPGERGTHEHS